ncbi:hypothetical protein [Glutamicibacter uratoxydans]|nr:hypothetical protein [Glutamicibacter uratoxydans]
MTEVGEGKHVIGVGYCTMLLTHDDELRLETVISDVWRLTSRADSKRKSRTKKSAWTPIVHFSEATVPNSGDCPELNFIGNELRNVIEHEVEHRGEHLLPSAAKAICEMSRENVVDIRNLRYELESRLAESSSNSNALEDFTEITAQLLQFNIISSKVADQAREAVREGLRVYEYDRDVYHGYRKLQDPTLLIKEQPATSEMRPWIRQHDAAIRQCLQLQLQMERESQTIQALVSSVVGISSSREADAQSRFNVLAVVFSIGIGVPALFLALYGASGVFKFKGLGSWTAMLPILLPLVLAAAFVLSRTPKGRAKKTWTFWSYSAIILMAGMFTLVLAYLAVQ